MAKQIPDWVAVGKEVVLAPYGFKNTWGNVFKITKVHKDGRFFITEQTSYRPNDCGKYGVEVGKKTRAYSPNAYPFEGEVKAKAEKSWRARTAKQNLHKLADFFNHVARNGDDDQLLTEELAHMKTIERLKP